MSQDHHQGPFHGRFLITAYSLLIVLIAGTSLYSLQHRQLVAAQRQIINLNQQLLTVQRHNLLAERGFVLKTSPNPATVAFNLKPLPVSLVMPDYLNLSYHYIPGNPEAAILSSSELTKLTSTCPAQPQINNVLGEIIYGQGQGKNNATTTVFRQTSNYYLAYKQPDALCSNQPTVIAALIGQQSILKQYLPMSAVPGLIAHPESVLGRG